MNIFQLLMSNPQQIVSRIIGNNPIASNLIKLINCKDEKGIEQLARNIAKEKGADADQLYNQIKNQFGL